ncbi:hypothetical protein D3C81_2313050 [compost metagenome]
MGAIGGEHMHDFDLFHRQQILVIGEHLGFRCAVFIRGGLGSFRNQVTEGYHLHVIQLR